MRTWFITGTSRGFGKLIASSALAAGDAVVATARDPESIPEFLRQHANLLALKLDVTNEIQAREAVRAAVQRFGHIDVLVNNAGYGVIGAIEETSAIEVERVFKNECVRPSQHHPRRTAADAGERWVRISRIFFDRRILVLSGIRHLLRHGTAVEGISEAMSTELQLFGIHATVVEPGYFRTTFLSDNSIVSTAARIDDYAGTVEGEPLQRKRMGNNLAIQSGWPRR